MTVPMIVALMVSCVFIYCFGIVFTHAVNFKTTKWDSVDSWAIGAFWPITLLFWLSWILIHKVPRSIFKWQTKRGAEKKSEEKARKDKYNTINIPKENISTSEEYRKLGQVMEELRNKLTLYEIANGVPVGERNS